MNTSFPFQTNRHADRRDICPTSSASSNDIRPDALSCITPDSLTEHIISKQRRIDLLAQKRLKRTANCFFTTSEFFVPDPDSYLDLIILKLIENSSSPYHLHRRIYIGLTQITGNGSFPIHIHRNLVYDCLSENQLFGQIFQPSIIEHQPHNHCAIIYGTKLLKETSCYSDNGNYLTNADIFNCPIVISMWVEILKPNFRAFVDVSGLIVESFQQNQSKEL
jgi:hypothetical protein